MVARSSPVFATLFVLALFSAYLTTGSLVTDRISPSIFFTLSICLAAATFHPTTPVAIASLAASITAQCFQSIDHIHGECGYEVLWGQRSWHQARLGDLAFYRQCSQPATAFWLMMTIAVLWSGVLARDAWQHYLSASRSIRLGVDDGTEAHAGNGAEPSRRGDR